MKIFEIDTELLIEDATSDGSEFVFVEVGNTDSAINRVLVPVFFAITAFFFLSDGIARKLMVKKPMPILFITVIGLLMMASINMSEHTFVTITRSGSQILFLTTLALLAYTLRDQERLLIIVGLAFLTALAIDIGLYFALGTGFTEQGGFTGYHRNKNVTGHQYGVATMVFISIAILRRNPLFLVVSLVSAAALLSSESRTAMGAIAIFVVFSLFYRIPLVRLIVLLLTLFGTVGFSMLLALGGNDPELFNNRGEIWNFLAPYIWDQPLLGYGFSSFWDVGQLSANQHYGVGFIESINTGHNGYIDLLLGLGFLGLGVFFVCLFFSAIHLSRLNLQFIFVHYLFIAFLISNVTESFAFYYQNVMWATLILLTSSTYAHYRPSKRRRQRSKSSSGFI